MAEAEVAQQEKEQDTPTNVVEIEASSPADKVPNGSDLAGEDGRVLGKFNFGVGNSLQEDIEMFGEELVREFWLRSAVIKGQSAVRRELENGTHPNDVAEQLADWRPDVQHTSTKDPKASVLQNFGKLSDDEKQALLEQLAAQAG